MYDESKIIELLQRRIIEEWDIKIKSDTIYNSYENYSLAAGLPGVILLLSEINYDEYKDQIDNYLIYIVKILSNNGLIILITSLNNFFYISSEIYNKTKVKKSQIIKFNR